MPDPTPPVDPTPPQNPSLPTDPKPPAGPVPPVDPKKPPVGNGLDNPPQDPPKDPPKSETIPENWRELVSGEDVKRLNQLKRYSSFNDAFNALFTLKEKISKGDVNKVLGENPTPEEIAEYRAANGIPEKPTDYQVKLGQDRKISEENQDAVNWILERLHKTNASPEVVSAAVDSLFDLQEQEENDQYEFDTHAKQTFEDKMRQEWGNDYRRNVTIARNFLEAAPEGLGAGLMQARLPDGTPLGSSPEFVAWMVDMSRQINPVATVMPNSGGDALNMLSQELADIEKRMGQDDSDYWKGPNAERLQARYRELVTARDAASR